MPRSRESIEYMRLNAQQSDRQHGEHICRDRPGCKSCGIEKFTCPCRDPIEFPYAHSHIDTGVVCIDKMCELNVQHRPELFNNTYIGMWS